MVICVIRSVLESWGTILRIARGIMRDMGTGGKNDRGDNMVSGDVSV
jgi:hypothetical protein